MDYNINFPKLHIYLHHVGQSINIGSYRIAFYGIIIAIGMLAGIAIACAVGLVLTQGRGKKGIVGKAIGGLASLYDITSYISDLLSY